VGFFSAFFSFSHHKKTKKPFCISQQKNEQKNSKKNISHQNFEAELDSLFFLLHANVA